jgi:hypothetical protein
MQARSPVRSPASISLSWSMVTLPQSPSVLADKHIGNKWPPRGHGSRLPNFKLRHCRPRPPGTPPFARARLDRKKTAARVAAEPPRAAGLRPYICQPSAALRTSRSRRAAGPSRRRKWTRQENQTSAYYATGTRVGACLEGATATASGIGRDGVTIMPSRSRAARTHWMISTSIR